MQSCSSLRLNCPMCRGLLEASQQLPLLSDLILREHKRVKKKTKNTTIPWLFFIWEQVLVFTGSCMFLLLWPACKGCNPSSATLYYSPPHFLAHRKFDIFRKISPRFAGADLQQQSSQLFKSHYFGLKR